MGAGHLVNVLDPALVAAKSVRRQANELGATLVELGLQAGESTQLGGAYGGKVLRVREEDDPVVTDELVEVDGALGSIGLEVGGDAAQAETKIRGGEGRSTRDVSRDPCFVFNSRLGKR